LLRPLISKPLTPQNSVSEEPTIATSDDDLKKLWKRRLININERTQSNQLDNVEPDMEKASKLVHALANSHVSNGCEDSQQGVLTEGEIRAKFLVEHVEKDIERRSDVRVNDWCKVIASIQKNKEIEMQRSQKEGAIQHAQMQQRYQLHQQDLISLQRRQMAAQAQYGMGMQSFLWMQKQENHAAMVMQMQMNEARQQMCQHMHQTIPLVSNMTSMPMSSMPMMPGAVNMPSMPTSYGMPIPNMGKAPSTSDLTTTSTPILNSHTVPHRYNMGLTHKREANDNRPSSSRPSLTLLSEVALGP